MVGCIFFRYCQGTGMMVASLLLLMEEEDAFWMMCTIVEELLPASYYSSTLIGKRICLYRLRIGERRDAQTCLVER